LLANYIGYYSLVMGLVTSILIFLLFISVKFLISVGDLKYTTFFSRDLKIRNIVNIIEIKINNKNKDLNLTFFPYMKLKN